MLLLRLTKEQPRRGITLVAGILVPAAASSSAIHSSCSLGYIFFPLSFLYYTYILFIKVGGKFLALENSLEWEAIKRHLKRVPLGLGALRKWCQTPVTSSPTWSKIRPRLFPTFCSHLPRWQFHFRSKSPFALASALCSNCALSWLPANPARLPLVMVHILDGVSMAWPWIPALFLTSSVWNMAA